MSLATRRRVCTMITALMVCVPLTCVGQRHYFQWGGTLGGDANDYINATAVDSAGNVFIIGSTFASSTNFDFNGGSSNFAGDATNSKAYLAKYDSSGTLKWVQALITSSGAQRGNSVAIDSGDNILVAGRFAGSATIGAGPSARAATSQGPSDLFFAKYDTSGTQLWAKVLTGSSVEYWSTHSIALDAAGNIFLAGHFGQSSETASVSFSPDPASINGTFVSPSGGVTAFVDKLDSSGNFLKAVLNGIPCDDENSNVTRIALDSAGNAYTTDTYGDGGCDGTNYASVYVIKFDNSLNRNWYESIETSTAAVNVYSLAVRSTDGVVAIAGDYAADIDLDPGVGTQTFTYSGTSGNVNAYLLQLNSDGSYRAGGTLAGSGISQIFAVSYDSAGRLYYGGNYSNNNLDPTTPGSHPATAISTDAVIGQIQADGKLGWLGSLHALTPNCSIGVYGALVPISYSKLIVSGNFNCGQVNVDLSASPELFNAAGGITSFLMLTLQDSIFEGTFDPQP